MVNKVLALTGFLALIAFNVTAQNDDPVLFSVENNPVRVSEFRYIYTKTNQDKADFSQASLQEYLDLYTKFKLKVQKARDMRLDTVSNLKNELEGYRRQLANSYLVDKEVTDKLVRETYERMLQDVDVSHIFIAADRNAKAADTLRAYNRALQLLKLVKGGMAFEKVAADSSDDKSAKDNKGQLGFVTAMLPDGYYNFEKAVYSAKPGDILGPVRTNAGYHILRVNAFRPARGEMEVAQLMLRKTDNAEKNALIKARIDSIYAGFRRGANWDESVNRFSEDKMTASKGGYIGFFGINRYQKSFEDAAFGLQKDGDISAPVETTIGWHLIKRISLRPVGTFDQMKRPLTERIRRDSRSEYAKRSMVARIKRESHYQEFPEALRKWTATQKDTVLFTFKWKANPVKPQETLMQYGNKSYTAADFEEYLTKASRERMRSMGKPIDEEVAKLFQAWSDDVAMQFEEGQLDKKYPEFKALMREYEEGILLFEATKQLVWDRANADTTGLEQYFENNLKNKYLWDERARVTFYTLKTDDAKVAADVRKLAAKKPAADVLKKFNKKENDLITVLEKTYEKGKFKDLDGHWQAGAMTDVKTDSGTKTATFIKVEEIIAPTAKKLNEARGYAVADYQDFLEKQWIDELRKTYKVTVDQKILQDLVRK